MRIKSLSYTNKFFIAINWNLSLESFPGRETNDTNSKMEDFKRIEEEDSSPYEARFIYSTT